jgi:hypothetical protein
VILTYHRRIMLVALLAGCPASWSSVLLLTYGDFDWRMRGALAALVAGLWIGLVLVLRDLIDRPLRTVSNVVAALRRGRLSRFARATRRQTTRSGN